MPSFEQRPEFRTLALSFQRQRAQGSVRPSSFPCHQRWGTVTCNAPCPQGEGRSVKPLPSPFTGNRTETRPLTPSPRSRSAPPGFRPLRPAFRPLPRARPREWRHMHLQLGNLIQVQRVREAALDAFVWLQPDTSRPLLCWQRIYPSPARTTSARGEFGGRVGAFQRTGWGRGTGPGPRAEIIAPRNMSDRRPLNNLLPELQRLCSLLMGPGKVPGSPVGWGRNQGNTGGCQWASLAVVSARKEQAGGLLGRLRAGRWTRALGERWTAQGIDPQDVALGSPEQGLQSPAGRGQRLRNGVEAGGFP